MTTWETLRNLNLKSWTRGTLAFQKSYFHGQTFDDTPETDTVIFLYLISAPCLLIIFFPSFLTCSYPTHSFFGEKSFVRGGTMSWWGNAERNLYGKEAHSFQGTSMQQSFQLLACWRPSFNPSTWWSRSPSCNGGRKSLATQEEIHSVPTRQWSLHTQACTHRVQLTRRLHYTRPATWEEANHIAWWHW